MSGLCLRFKRRSSLLLDQRKILPAEYVPANSVDIFAIAKQRRDKVTFWRVLSFIRSMFCGWPVAISLDRRPLQQQAARLSNLQ